MVAAQARRALIERAGALLVDAFDDYNARFSDITRRARRNFLKRDWARQKLDARARIELYDQCVAETIGRLELALDERLLSRTLWLDIHADYAQRIESRLDAELYKTFFNTLTRRLFKTRGVDAGIEFVALDIEPTEQITHPVDRNIYSLGDDPVAACRRLLADGEVQPDARHLDPGAAALAARLQADLAAFDDRPISIELLTVMFYRDRRAWRIGRVFGSGCWRPFMLALSYADDGIRADALLTDRRSVSILFGYTWSYFHADLATVGDAIVFLRTLLPDKPLDELYTVLGRAKQGKTERYRHFFKHLEKSRERLVEADGTRGMVMLVFTLPGYPLVFKLMRDRFAPGKKLGREHVLAQYRLVFNHDRAGRLIDAQEYRHLAFDRSRFSDALLAVLTAECGRSVTLEGSGDSERVILRHCFVQRRVRPLNLYLAEADPDSAREAVLDYGQAIRDLARSNLFPGDLFLKNFGVTRSGRVVFYDYDEVSLVTDLNFRETPVARSDELEFSGQTWFAVEPGDVFPRDFRRFVDLAPEHRERFAQVHGELFEPGWWRELQAGLRDDPAAIQPYPEHARLRHMTSGA
ncbi:MAG: bifunctional isocitrate dehydrogenase kinase/phosphatase [Gammaproteobacteria bacterium HGW-Gammaproteobacteria-8]|nr:MAG: bifunctional isocitrate dehydrogenase kinase/phosphatase [Gammaproteobacteria bacterium HGW-Gammaproteobacteria-8]